MNAYELADQVEMWGEDLLALNMKGGIPVIEGARLIRQQADRIADLETALAFKKMKPLSDEAVNEAYLKHGNSGWDWQIAFAREIEERHGIK